MAAHRLENALQRIRCTRRGGVASRRAGDVGGAAGPMSGTPQSSGVASPCIGVCRIDEASGVCAGCLRTLDEIAAWVTLDDDARRAVWRAIGERRAAKSTAARVKGTST